MSRVHRWAVQLAWLLAIWCLSVCLLGFAAWAMRGLMRAAGMS